MAREHESNARLARRFDEVEDLAARQPEHHLDAGTLKRPGKNLRGRGVAHRRDVIASPVDSP